MSDELDLKYLVEWSRERQREAQAWQARGGDRCPKCPHEYHGLQCIKPQPGACGCRSSFEEKTA